MTGEQIALVVAIILLAIIITRNTGKRSSTHTSVVRYTPLPRGDNSQCTSCTSCGKCTQRE